VITASVPARVVQLKEKFSYIHFPKVGLTYHFMQLPYTEDEKNDAYAGCALIIACGLLLMAMMLTVILAVLSSFIDFPK